MTAPRPEAVELARGLLTAANMRIIPDGGLDLHDLEPHFIERIDAALTAARADERERCAKVCEAMTKEIVCPEECAAAIRAMEGR